MKIIDDIAIMIKVLMEYSKKKKRKTKPISKQIN